MEPPQLRLSTCVAFSVRASAMPTAKSDANESRCGKDEPSMSTVSSRPRIKGVVITAATGTVISGAAVAHGLIRAVGAAGRALHRELQLASDAVEVQVRPLSVVRAEQRSMATRLEAHVRGLHEIDELKARAATRLTSYVLEDASRLAAPLHALESAGTLRQARKASGDLLRAAEAEHCRLFNERLVAACTRASAVSGFANIVTRVDACGATRIVATSESGAALVTEIPPLGDADARMATELVGLYDGTCTEVMNRFDVALEAEGVRAAPPHRQFTGGVCELAAAREFVREQFDVQNSATAESAKATSARRRRLRNSVTRHRSR
jgi:hypothetical protein